jgi:hypothetical protein
MLNTNCCWCSVINLQAEVIFECEHIGSPENVWVWRGQETPVPQVILFQHIREIIKASPVTVWVVGVEASKFEAWCEANQ